MNEEVVELLPSTDRLPELFLAAGITAVSHTLGNRETVCKRPRENDYISILST
jgi:hypothetical protein